MSWYSSALHDLPLSSAVLQRLASSRGASSSRQTACHRLLPAARKSRPFARPQQQQQPAETEIGQFTAEELAAAASTELSDEEVLTQAYLQSLEDETWTDDPPDHRSGYVAIVGRPNAGKSTLVNALVGQKLSIVTAKAQTTRHRILSLVNDEKSQMILLDTPGILHTQRNRLDARMMRAVWQAARDADALLAIVDASAEPKEALAALHQVLEGRDARSVPVALVLNKVDLLGGEEVSELAAWFEAEARADAVIPISAKTGAGVQEVRRWAAAQLPPGPSLYSKDVLSEEPERFFIAEIVREQIFLQYREEVPYSSTAEVIDYTERPGAKDLVRVAVTVETDGQRGIVIGKGGAALKQLSTAARLSIEDFLGKPIFLDISVKVKKAWRADDSSVSSFGY